MIKRIAIFFIYAYVALSLFLPIAAISNAGLTHTITPEIQESVARAADNTPLMDTILGISTDNGNESALLQIWKTMMVFVNAMVVAFLIFIAVANVFRFNIDTYAIKKMLPEIVKGIVLANFSIWIGRMVIESAGVLTAWLQFGTAFEGGGHSLPAQYYNVIFTGRVDGDLKAANSLLGASLDGILGAALVATYGVFAGGGCYALILVILLILAPALVFLFLYFVFMIRQYILFALIAVSPLAFFSIATPWTKKYFSQWWDLFIKWVFMVPITLFIMRIALIFGTHMDGLLRLVAMTAFTYFAIKIPMSWGGAAMNSWMGFLKQGANVGKNTYGLAWRWGQNGMKIKQRKLFGKTIIPGWGGSEKAGRFFKATNLYGIQDAKKKRADLFQKDIMQSAQESTPYRKTATYRAMARQIWGEKSDQLNREENPANVEEGLKKKLKGISKERGETDTSPTFIARQQELAKKIAAETSPDKLYELGREHGLNIDDTFHVKASLSRLLALERSGWRRGSADAIISRLYGTPPTPPTPLSAAGLSGGQPGGQNPYLANVGNLGVNAQNVSINKQGGISALEHFASVLKGDEETTMPDPHSLALVGAATELGEHGLEAEDEEELIALIKEKALLRDDQSDEAQRIEEKMAAIVRSVKYLGQENAIRESANIMARSYAGLIEQETRSFMADQTLPIGRATQLIQGLLTHDSSRFGKINAEEIERLQIKAREYIDKANNNSSLGRDPELFNRFKQKIISEFGESLVKDIDFKTIGNIQEIGRRLKVAAQGLEHLKTPSTLATINSKGANGILDAQQLRSRIEKDFRNSFSQKDFADHLGKAIASAAARGTNIGDKTIDHLADRMESILDNDEYTHHFLEQLSQNQRTQAVREVTKETVMYAGDHAQTTNVQIDPVSLTKAFKKRSFQLAFGRVMATSLKSVTQQLKQSNSTTTEAITDAATRIEDAAAQSQSGGIEASNINPMTEIPPAEPPTQPPQN